MIKTGLLDNNHLSTLKKAVDVYARRHVVTAENISNVQTSGYRARELKFEEFLNGATNRLKGYQTHANHMPIGNQGVDQGRTELANSDSVFDNGVNNVDIDGEMANLATNDLSYRLATRLLSLRYQTLRGAIKGQIR